MPKKDEVVSIIIPAYNEAESIGSVVQELIKGFKGKKVEILVIDDGSNDHTGESARMNGATVIRHSRNKGYGAALKTGIRNAHGSWVLFMDADGQHRAEDALKLLSAVGQNDMVVGQRAQLVHSPFWRMPGKWALGWMANYLTRQRIPDLNSGLRLIKREIVARYMGLCPNGFSFSTTITMIMFNRGYEIAYVPFEIRTRRGKSTVSVATGLDTLLLILRIATLIDPLRIFVPLSLIIGFIGLAWGIPYAIMGNGISVGSMLAIVTSILLFSIGLISDQISQMRLEKM
jgi:glycosyltransferase involved in cell wall biosynthesis